MKHLLKIGIVAAIAGAYVAWKNRKKYQKFDPNQFLYTARDNGEDIHPDPAQIMGMWMQRSNS